MFKAFFFAPNSKRVLGRSILLVGVSAILLTLAGCYPRNILWLPDSSGIVYAEKGDSQLARYDLTRKASKVICETGTKTPWPAISRDGKRIAVAKRERVLTEGSDVVTLRTQVIIYDIDGTEQKRSSIHIVVKRDVPAKATITTIEETALNWSGPPDKILIADAGIFDCVRDKWINIRALFSPWNNTPVRPDGKGFLGFSNKSFVFVDWDGWITEFKDMPEDPVKDVVSFEWQKNTARISDKNGVHEFNTDAMKYVFRNDPPRFDGDGELTWVNTFSGTELKLAVFHTKTKKGTEDISLFRLDAVIPSAKKRRTLIDDSAINLGGLSFFPSPDGEMVAIRFCQSGFYDRETILVVNRAGETLKTISPESR